MKTLTPIKENSYRSTQPVYFWNFPESIDPFNLKVKGYLQGERTNSKQQLTVHHFDSISFVSVTYNDNDLKRKKPMYVCIGLRDREKSQKVLILQATN